MKAANRWAATLLFLAAGTVPCMAQDPAQWDPYKAEKALEVGRFYLKKKNYDAAIERFLECISYRPEYAVPHRLLGEAYEKKNVKEEAVKYYEKYLAILPQARDAEKIRKRIAELKKSVQKSEAEKKNPT
jgi:tetratricopeptide (TPR) repeat protein